MRKLSTLLICLFALVGCNGKQEISTESPSALTELLNESNKVAIIKFYAEWCSSCKQYAPAFTQVKTELADKADFFEIDVDDSSYKALVKELKVSRIPDTVFVSKDRKTINKVLGSIPVDHLSKLINETITQ